MRRFQTACAVAMLVVLPMGCSSHAPGDSGDSGDREAGRSGPSGSAIARAEADIPEVKRLFDRLPGPGDMATGSPGSFCAANRAAVRTSGFAHFQRAVNRIESQLPDDMPKEPRIGYGLMLHALGDAGDKGEFAVEINRFDTAQQDLIEAYRRYGDTHCGALAPDSAALA
ncbi:MAG: hypothetical protein L0H93_14305 [Nocardioides sp.]|nr:hypothetical protein [Nocardioides sp.]